MTELSLFGDVSGEAEKWVGPVLTSALSLAATFFAYLGGRDKLIYDSDRRLERAEIERLKADAIERKAENAACKLENEAIKEEVERLRLAYDELRFNGSRRRDRTKQHKSTDSPVTPPPPGEG